VGQFLFSKEPNFFCFSSATQAKIFAGEVKFKAMRVKHETWKAIRFQYESLKAECGISISGISTTRTIVSTGLSTQSTKSTQIFWSIWSFFS
jgi:hypothetical protein